MVPCPLGWERLQVVADSLAGRDVRSLDVPDHPVEVFGALIREVTVRIRQNQRPERVGIMLGGAELHMRHFSGFLGLDDIAWSKKKKEKV